MSDLGWAQRLPSRCPRVDHARTRRSHPLKPPPGEAGPRLHCTDTTSAQFRANTQVRGTATVTPQLWHRWSTSACRWRHPKRYHERDVTCPPTGPSKSSSGLPCATRKICFPVCISFSPLFSILVFLCGTGPAELLSAWLRPSVPLLRSNPWGHLHTPAKVRPSPDGCCCCSLIRQWRVWQTRPLPRWPQPQPAAMTRFSAALGVCSAACLTGVNPHAVLRASSCYSRMWQTCHQFLSLPEGSTSYTSQCCPCHEVMGFLVWPSFSLPHGCETLLHVHHQWD